MPDEYKVKNDPVSSYRNYSNGGENKVLLLQEPKIKKSKSKRSPFIVKGVKGLPPIKTQKRPYVPIEIPYKKYKRREAIRERLMR
jgi:hypothetical protein